MLVIIIDLVVSTCSGTGIRISIIVDRTFFNFHFRFSFSFSFSFRFWNLGRHHQFHCSNICLYRADFFEKKIYFIQKKTNRQKKYIYTLQNLYTHTINIEDIIYMQESSGHPHIDQYRSKLYSLYTSNDRL